MQAIIRSIDPSIDGEQTMQENELRHECMHVFSGEGNNPCMDQIKPLYHDLFLSIRSKELKLVCMYSPGPLYTEGQYMHH